LKYRLNAQAISESAYRSSNYGKFYLFIASAIGNWQMRTNDHTPFSSALRTFQSFFLFVAACSTVTHAARMLYTSQLMEQSDLSRCCSQKLDLMAYPDIACMHYSVGQP